MFVVLCGTVELNETARIDCLSGQFQPESGRVAVYVPAVVGYDRGAETVHPAG